MVLKVIPRLSDCTTFVYGENVCHNRKMYGTLEQKRLSQSSNSDIFIFTCIYQCVQRLSFHKLSVKILDRLSEVRESLSVGENLCRRLNILKIISFK